SLETSPDLDPGASTDERVESRRWVEPDVRSLPDRWRARKRDPEKTSPNGDAGRIIRGRGTSRRTASGRCRRLRRTEAADRGPGPAGIVPAEAGCPPGCCRVATARPAARA